MSQGKDWLVWSYSWRYHGNKFDSLIFIPNVKKLALLTTPSFMALIIPLPRCSVFCQLRTKPGQFSQWHLLQVLSASGLNSCLTAKNLFTCLCFSLSLEENITKTSKQMTVEHCKTTKETPVFVTPPVPILLPIKAICICNLFSHFRAGDLGEFTTEVSHSNYLTHVLRKLYFNSTAF